MAQTTARKLGIKPSMRVSVTGQQADHVEALLGELPEGVNLAGDEHPADIVLFFADTVADVSTCARSAWQRVLPDGRLWIAYRKGASKAKGVVDPLHRDTLQAALEVVNLEGVTLVSLDETWSALRVKPLRHG